MTQRKQAFTLVEAITVLLLIGVVMAMVTPTVIANFQNRQYVVAYRKAYSNLNQILRRFTTDRGCIGDIKCTGVFSESSSDEDLGDALIPYFKVIKNCESGEGCWASTVFYNYDSTESGSPENTGYSLISVDGIGYRFINYSSDCAENLGRNAASSVCAEIEVDVNGPIKGPNTYGRDIYLFYLANGNGPAALPVGSDILTEDNVYGQYESGSCCTSSNRGGYCCGARIIEDGWQIKY